MLECPYFKTNGPNESKEGIDLKSEEGPTFFSLGMVSPSGTQSPSSIKEHERLAGASEEYSEQSPSPNSGNDINLQLKLWARMAPPNIYILNLYHYHSLT